MKIKLITENSKVFKNKNYLQQDQCMPTGSDPCVPISCTPTFCHPDCAPGHCPPHHLFPIESVVNIDLIDNEKYEK
ncbi:MAG: hypothetical protein KDK90_28310 [Leptospiraceae bacterium]|nr:hypothetical protein [Leptospiraceae bacterium]